MVVAVSGAVAVAVLPSVLLGELTKLVGYEVGALVVVVIALASYFHELGRVQNTHRT